MQCLLVTMLSVVVISCAFVAQSQAEQYSAMDLIIQANKGKEHLMNVDKFDIRFPKYEDDAIVDQATRQKRAAAKDKSRLWKKGVIPFVVHRSLVERPGFHANLKKALKEWMTYTCLKFRPKKARDRNYVTFLYGVGCNADVGRKGGAQQVSLGQGCSDTSVIIHEIGHVIGFWHEQNRPDREKYVDIKWENILDKFKFAFLEYTRNRVDSRDVPYDFQSIMHYGNDAFTKNSKDTIVAKVKGVKKFGNQHLSPLDIKQVNRMYECPDVERVFPKFPDHFTTTTNGTIPGQVCVLTLEPRKTRKRPVWLCYKQSRQSPGIRWSSQGVVRDMVCTHISSPFGEDRHRLWNDNYLCVNNQTEYEFQWSKGKRIAGLDCLQWATFRAYLCAKPDHGPVDGGWSAWTEWTTCSQECGGGYQERRRYCTNPEPKNLGKPCYGEDYSKRFCNLQECSEYPRWPRDFFFRYFPKAPTGNCVRISDRYSGSLWDKYYFCSSANKRNLLMKWSGPTPQKGMRCTKIFEPLEADGWRNNYLCIPPDSSYRFQWSNSGPIAGSQCVQWLAKNGSDGWDNNYLCGHEQLRQMLAPAADMGEAPDRAPKFARAGVSVRAIHGGWSVWSGWSSCSQSCDRGYQHRSRTCTEPTPSERGRPCEGRNRQMKRCFVTQCAIPCSGRYSGKQGTLESPPFPNYPHKCQWIVTVPVGRRVEMKFTEMQLKGPQSTCSKDNLIIRDGDNSQAKVLRQFCHNSNVTQTIHSTGNTMFMELHSDKMLNKAAFKAQWSSLTLDSCVKTYTARSGSLTSPRYPDKYPNNIECRWLIRVRLDPRRHKLKAKFDDFSLENSAKCAYDKLEIFNGATETSRRKTFCGKTKPTQTITAARNALFVRFTSDRNRNYKGFRLSWSVVRRRR